jgi:membrane protease subunit (stomatin/prohibitin family)
VAFLSREFIAVPDDRKNQILFKWPDHNIRRFSQLIVEPDMLAVFVSRGAVVGQLGPGKHQVDAQEIPSLGILIDAATGGNAYRAELFFVGTHEYVSQRFGGRIDDIQDPASQLLVGLRVFGDYSVRVTDPTRLILQLTGTVDVADNTKVTAWIAEQLLRAMRQLVTKKVVTGEWPVISTSAYSDEIEAGSIGHANEVLATYGLQLSRLGNFDISLVPEDAARLKQLAEDIRRSQLAGSYSEMARVQLMQGAAEGLAQGGGAGPALLGVGLGVAGQAVAPAPAGAPPPEQINLAPQAGGGGAGAAGSHPCSSCDAAVPTGAKFCASCGTAQPQTRFCTNCGSELAAGAKFCGECGTAAGGAAAGGNVK